MFTVKVIEASSGKPAYYKRVAVIFKGFARGCAKDQYTDKNGEAHFPEDNSEGTIYVQGTKMFEGRIEERVVIYI